MLPVHPGERKGISFLRLQGIHAYPESRNAYGWMFCVSQEKHALQGLFTFSHGDDRVFGSLQKSSRMQIPIRLAR